MTLESLPPVTFKDGTAQELSMNAAWGTGLVHALQHEGIFGAWWTLWKMQGWAGLLVKLKTFEAVAVLFP